MDNIIISIPASELNRKCRALKRLRRLQHRAKLLKYKTTHIGYCYPFTLYMNDDELFVENRNGQLITDDLALGLINFVEWHKVEQ